MIQEYKLISPVQFLKIFALGILKECDGIQRKTNKLNILIKIGQGKIFKLPSSLNVNRIAFINMYLIYSRRFNLHGVWR